MALNESQDGFTEADRVTLSPPSTSDVGDHNVVVRVTDSSGSSTDQSFTITVANTNDAPTVANAIADQSTAEDASFSYQVPSNAFADVDSGTTLTYTATLSNGSSLPSWLSFNTSTRTFSGTPTNAEVGTVAVKVTASDGSASVSDTFNITVTNVNDAPVITSTPTTALSFLDKYEYTMAASDVDSGSSITLAATTLPSWLSFNTSNGTLSGNPTSSHLGNHNVVLTAIDNTGLVTTQSFTITVENSEFRVNTEQSNAQSNPTITTLVNGNVVITYVSTGQDSADSGTSNTGIFAKIYNGVGTALGNEFQVNTDASGSQTKPDVASLSDGGFVITWETNKTSEDGMGIYGQRYNSAGTKVGGEFQINTYETSDQVETKVTGLKGGGFVAIWNSKNHFINWTKSEAFRLAHKNSGQHKGLYLGHPNFEGFEVVL